MRAGNWIRTEGMELTGKTLGLLGFGGIAAEVARIACRVRDAGAGVEPDAEDRAVGVTFVDVDTLLAESQVLSMHLLLNDETRGFLSAERLGKPAARRDPGEHGPRRDRGRGRDDRRPGRSGHLRHAALDVFGVEPLPAGHRLTTLPNVTLSAHSAFRTPEASDKLIRMALDIACGLVSPECRLPMTASICDRQLKLKQSGDRSLPAC